MTGLRVSIDFLGGTLAQAGDAPAVINVELDRAPLETYRQKFPRTWMPTGLRWSLRAPPRSRS
ncbi:MAG TPA: hypothetical protein VN869_02170 [Steroidobacteraceae bacterium]|nr:hypothetical protein [Steroidobacteraceae bacterium]